MFMVYEESRLQSCPEQEHSQMDFAGKENM